MDRTELIDILDDFCFGSHDIEKTADRITKLHKKANIEQLRIGGVVKSFYCYDETVQIAEETGDKIIKCDTQCENCKQ